MRHHPSRARLIAAVCTAVLLMTPSLPVQRSSVLHCRGVLSSVAHGHHAVAHDTPQLIVPGHCDCCLQHTGGCLETGCSTVAIHALSSPINARLGLRAPAVDSPIPIAALTTRHRPPPILPPPRA